MYQPQTKFIDDKIAELSKKAMLRKLPKLKLFKKTVPLAYYNSISNRLGVSEFLLERWQKGLYDEKDIEAILAHEIGHAIANQQKSRHESKAARHFLIFIAMVLALSLKGTLASSILQLLVLAGFLMALIYWALCIPWVIRSYYVPSELDADRNAVTFDLVKPEQLIRQMIRAQNVASLTKEIQPLDTLRHSWYILTHPSMADRLRNLNCKIGRIEVEKSN